MLAAGLTVVACIASVVLPHALNGTGEDSGDDGPDEDVDVDWSESWSDRRCTEGLLWRVSDGVCCIGERPRPLCEPLRPSRCPLLPLRHSVTLPSRRRGLAGGVLRAWCRLRLGDLTRRDRCRFGEQDLLRARLLRLRAAGLQSRRGELEWDRRRRLRSELPPLGSERVCLRLIDQIWRVTELWLRWPVGVLDAAGCCCSGSGSGDGVSAGSGGGASSFGSGGEGETIASSVGSGGGGDEGASSAGSGGGGDVGGTAV